MSIKVYSGTSALTAIRERPNKVLTISKKKNDRSYGGATFLDAKWAIEPNRPVDGWFSFRDVKLARGITNPVEVKQGSKEIYESVRLSVRFKQSSLGDFGLFIRELEPQWQQLVVDSQSAGLFTLTKKQEVHNLLCLQSPESAGPVEIFEDPTIKFKLDFSKYSDKHPNEMLKGRQKSKILDGNKPYTDKTGRIQYETAVITNADGTTEDITAANVHKFITNGCVAVHARIYIPSAVLSAGWLSLPMLIDEITIVPGAPADFDDEEAQKASPDASDEKPAIKSLSPPDIDQPVNADAIKEIGDMIEDL